MGDKIPIALNDGGNIIVSQIYPVLKIKDKNKLLPEYLLMWFKDLNLIVMQDLNLTVAQEKFLNMKKWKKLKFQYLI